MENKDNLPSREESIAKLNAMMKDVKFAMMTTSDDNGVLRSRPMATIEQEFDGTVWFFTSKDSGKVHSIENDQHVNLAYVNLHAKDFISAAGHASLVEDRQKIKELWNPVMKAWFPDGENDPQLALLKIEIESAEIWDSPSSTVAHIIGLAKATVTGQAYQDGKQPERVEFKH